MRSFIRLAILFYVVVIALVGFTSLLILAHVFSLDHYLQLVRFICSDPNAATVTAFIIAATLIISLVFARIIYGRQEQERRIQFDNPLGKVTISLSAIEDLIRRLEVFTPQIKELRPDISATKRGLDVEVRLVLRSDVNIPEMTANLQDIIKQKIQGVVGFDERVTVRVHVIKIVSDASYKGKGEDEVVVRRIGTVPRIQGLT